MLFSNGLGMLPEDYLEDQLGDEKQIVPRKVGRPVKTVYDKVLKMIEAKRKKREIDHTDINNEESVEDGTVNNENTNEVTVPPPKKKIGRPRKQVTAAANAVKDEVTYIPRRSHVKAKEGTERSNKN
ncbi:hypothetical protein ILUMI_12917 [Ignelater luminosus]|uniref:Uncharacterized protein n=1 Tax=Ignelater luminosus TaxID=2038154 RepID=A0A8K0CXL5_IGNLU|nr:hypothetical protein ILUMI_12917 [Ignelater luminosus]